MANGLDAIPTRGRLMIPDPADGAESGRAAVRVSSRGPRQPTAGTSGVAVDPPETPVVVTVDNNPLEEDPTAAAAAAAEPIGDNQGRTLLRKPM